MLRVAWLIQRFKEQQTTVWSAISKARASLRASSIHPETQQRAAEQILQMTRCKNGSLKCQSLIHSIWKAPCASCLSAMPQNGSEKRRGPSITMPDHLPLRRIRKGWAPGLRRGKQNNPYLTENCSDPFIELSLKKKIMSWFTWLGSSLKF